MELLFHKKIQEKKFLIFQETETQENFLYFPKWNFSIKAQKIKKNSPWENFLYFLYFLKRKLFYILGNGNPEKGSYISSKESFSYIPGNGNPKKILLFQEVSFRDRKMKKPTLKNLLIFQEIELSNLILKKLSCISEKNIQSPKSKKFIVLSLIKKQNFLS